MKVVGPQYRDMLEAVRDSDFMKYIDKNPAPTFTCLVVGEVVAVGITAALVKCLPLGFAIPICLILCLVGPLMPIWVLAKQKSVTAATE